MPVFHRQGTHTVKIACSNIAFPPLDHTAMLRAVADMGVTGIEVAPSRVWPNTWEGLDSAAVTEYRRAIENTGLHTVGLHSLFFDHPELGLFKDRSTLSKTIDFLVHLSAVCRDLGGRTLIYGGGRRRGPKDIKTADTECREFLDTLLPRIEPHGTILCFEPLGPRDTDFLNTATACLDLVGHINHPALGFQLDAKALVENGETGPEIFAAARTRLIHYHANDPELAVIGSSGEVDHQLLAQRLQAIRYSGWVSIEQRMFNRPLEDVAASVAAVRRTYGGENE